MAGNQILFLYEESDFYADNKVIEGIFCNGYFKKN